MPSLVKLDHTQVGKGISSHRLSSTRREGRRRRHPATPGHNHFARAIADAIEAYKAVRWPEGKVPGGKG